MAVEKITAKKMQELIQKSLSRYQGIRIADATNKQIYEAVCLAVRDILVNKRLDFKHEIRAQKKKQVYYMSMEFLLGRSLKNHLYNLGLTETVTEVLDGMGIDINDLYECEPDAGLGNGGLGRLAAAYMDALTSHEYPACGFSIRYDYGIFRQRVVDGWQMEMPDTWLKEGGDVWLAPRSEETFEVHFGGKINEHWENGQCKIYHTGYTTILAEAYDMHISGYHTKAVNRIRLWAAKAPVDLDMELFSRGEYLKASENKALAESISKILYPADNHIEGKALRLKQQYFFVSASIQSIIKNHLKFNPNLDNLADQVAIHINDTHPTLCIPELMRILLDVYGYSWESAWDIIKKVISYTNHTVMAEALEKWPEDLVRNQIPRIHQIICEMNRRYCVELWNAFPGDWERVTENAIMSYGEIKMANLCLYASHTVNGVSALHSDILTDTVFKDAYKMTPEKFTNVTNGITHRRWLCEANPRLTELLCNTIGDDFIKTADLSPLMRYQGDKTFLDALGDIKTENKKALAKYIKDNNNVVVSEDSIFDVQVKRIHEYKRQLLNAMHILDLYLKLKDNPNMDILPRTYIFAGKAASSYYVAKLVIRMISQMEKVINNDKSIGDKLKVVFLENYRVSLAEVIMPASEISEQISVAGKEASGTGNMKFMINGAVTVGTMDGANVEISERVGSNNIFIFGLRSNEVAEMVSNGYSPSKYYNNDIDLKRVIDYMREGIGGVSFAELANLLTIGLNGSKADPYLCMADFRSYANIQNEVDQAYRDRERWNRMSLVNIAQSGFFAADRAVEEYCSRIWNLKKVK